MKGYKGMSEDMTCLGMQYEKASKVHFAKWARETGEFNELIDQFPQEVWLY